MNELELKKFLTNKKGCVNSAALKNLKGERMAAFLKYTSHIEGTISEKACCFINDMESVPTCKNPNCNSKCKRIGGQWNEYCSNECCTSDPARVEKSNKTKAERYGENFNEVLSEKIKQTIKEKYGCDFPLQSKHILNKTIETQVALYGDMGFRSVNNRTKAQDTLKKRYGVNSGNAYLEPAVREKLDEADLKKMHLEQKMSLTEIGERIGVSTTTIIRRLGINSVRHSGSRFENYVVEFIKSLDPDIVIKQNDRTVIRPKELDIYLPDYKLAIEVNGLWYHSEEYGIDNKYHIDKTISCDHQGIQLLHLFESDFFDERELWKPLITKKLHKVNNKIGARQLIVREISASESASFLNAFHFQGNARSTIRYGLYSEHNQLVAVSSFGKSRMSTKFEWELIRYCTHPNITIVGGAGKLFKHFVKHHTPISVISYSDKRMFNGNMYQKLGFSYSHTSKPNYWYFNKKEMKLYNRMNFQKHKLEKKLEKFNRNKSEWENMKNNGWNRIWDCGNDVWIWKQKKGQ